MMLQVGVVLVGNRKKGTGPDRRGKPLSAPALSTANIPEHENKSLARLFTHTSSRAQVTSRTGKLVQPLSSDPNQWAIKTPIDPPIEAKSDNR